MAELQLGGKTIATQTGTAEPVIASNVTGTLGSGVDISNVTGTLSNNVFPAGHIIQQTTGSFTYTGDAGTASNTEVFGPVVNLTCVNANAKLFALIFMPECYLNNNSLTTIGIAFKNSSFSAGDGVLNSTAGATLLSADTCKVNRNTLSPATMFVMGDISNTAGQTMYISAFCTGSSNTFYWNFAGATGVAGKITVMEIQK